MAGYADTKKLIEDTLVGRPAGSLIYPEGHQAMAMSLLDYIHSVELLGASELQGIATTSTVPVQPDNAKVSYIATVPAGQTYVFTNFHDQNGDSISITTGANTVSLLTFLWNGEYWQVQNSQVQLMLNITAGYLYAGIAIPTTNPGSPDEPIFYIAAQAGTYTNFGNIVVNDGEAAILKYVDSSWVKEISGLATREELSQLAQEFALINSVVSPLVEGTPGEWKKNAEIISSSGTGGFTGRGLAIAENKTLYKVYVSIAQRSASSPITQVKLTLRKDSRAGDILATKTVPFSVSDTLYHNVEFDFTDSPVTYSGVIYCTMQGNADMKFNIISASDYVFTAKASYCVSTDLSTDVIFAQSSNNNTIPGVGYIDELVYALKISNEQLKEIAPDAVLLNEDITAAKTIAGYYVNVANQDFRAASTRSAAIFPFELNHTYKFNVPKTGNSYSALYAFMTDLDQTTNLVVSSDVGNEAERQFEIKNTNADYIYIAITYTTSDGAPTCVDITELPEAVKTNRQKINEIQEEIAGGLDSSIDINVPDIVFAVVGDTLQLYYESIFKVVNPFNYDIKVNCNIGAQYPRYFQVLPTVSQIGDYQLGFIIKNYAGKTLGEKTVTLRVVNCVSSPASQLNVLCVGASTTNGGEWVGEMKKRLTTAAGTPTVGDGQTLFQPVGFSRSNIAFVGRKEANDVKFEATGGFNYNSYLSSSTYRIRFNFTEENAPSGISEGDIYTDGTSQFTIVEINIPSGGTEYGYISCTCPTNPASAGLTLTKVSGTGEATLIASSYAVLGNPFVFDGQINIQRYANEYCNGQIDVVFAYLFSNGIITPYQTDFSASLASMQSFINLFTAVFPSCKFCILLSQNKDVRGGLGYNYGASQTSIWTYEFGMKVANHNLLTALQQYITDNSLSNSVYIVNNLNEFDYMNDYRQTMKIVNPRSPVKEVFGINGVHPSTIGYYQIADSATRLFVAKFCQQ